MKKMYKTRRKRKRARRDARERFLRTKARNIMGAEPGPSDLVLVLDGLKPSFNIGKIFRSADALGVREIHLVNITWFDPAPAMGSFKWVPAVFHPDFATCHQALAGQGYELFAFEPAIGIDLPAAEIPEKSGFIFGHEEFGLSFDLAAYPGIRTLRIPQFGKVESLNVSIAASIAMYEYVRRHAGEVVATQDLPGWKERGEHAHN